MGAHWEIVHAGGRFTLPLGRLLQPLSMMIGAAAGGIIGAIAGRTAADPNSAPLPRWVIYAVLVIFLCVILLGVIVGFLMFLPKDPTPARGPGPDQGPNQREPEPRPNPVGDVAPAKPGGPK